MRILLQKETLLRKKAFTTNDFNAPNNTAANGTATNTANDNAFDERKLFLKTMLHLLTVFQKLMA